MGVISKEALELWSKVRDHYPKTCEWVKHKANWECMPVGAVCMDYRSHIEELMASEDGGADNGLSD